MPFYANICEGCGAAHPKSYGLWDYCAACGKNLCCACMEKGCCGKVPAASGNEIAATERKDKA